MNKPQIGSISWGTMRSEDLLPDFFDVLKELQTEEEKQKDKALYEEIETLLDKEEWTEEEEEQVSFIINEDLWNRLNEACPSYMYFGSTEGDGCDYGFWINFNAIEEAVQFNELLKVEDLGEVEEEYTGEVIVVNDHGNAILYSFDKGKSEEIWSIV